MKTYYDSKTFLQIGVENGTISFLRKKPTFIFDEAIAIPEEEWAFYGRIGTAFHSGKQTTSLVRFQDTTGLVNFSTGYRAGVNNHYAVCADSFNESEFVEKNMFPFFTKATEIMPDLGFVCKKENLVPSSSLFEEKNPVSGVSLFESFDWLKGDNVGQLVQTLLKAMPVYNEIYTSVFENQFYGATLSLLPLRGLDPTVIMPWRSFYRYFKGVSPILADLTKSTPVCFPCDPEIFGFENVKVYTGSQPTLLSGFWGFVNFFSGGEVDFLYSYQGQHSEVVAGYNMMLIKN